MNKFVGFLVLASIGPRLFRHGNVRDVYGIEINRWILELQLGHVFSDMEIGKQPRPSKRTEPKCFNWATSFQTWKLSEISGLHPKTINSGFNWATSFQTWK